MLHRRHLHDSKLNLMTPSPSLSLSETPHLPHLVCLKPSQWASLLPIWKLLWATTSSRERQLLKLSPSHSLSQ
jgi:hypothetical protein